MSNYTNVSPLRGREDEVLRLCRSGLTDKQVAARLGVKYWQVRFVRYKHGQRSLYDNGRRMPTGVVKRMLAAGKGYAQIAEKVGKTPDQVRWFCSNHGLSMASCRRAN